MTVHVDEKAVIRYEVWCDKPGCVIQVREFSDYTEAHDYRHAHESFHKTGVST